jgi:hypothetical protein
MCYFINVGLPQKAKQRWIEKLPRNLYASAGRYEKLSELRNDFSVVTITNGMCSCDLFNRKSDEDEFKKGKKKGWSENKIARAIENSRKAAIQNNLNPDFRRWLSEVVEDAGEAYLLVHWDADPLDLKSPIVLVVEAFRRAETYIADEQLFHLKANHDNGV